MSDSPTAGSPGSPVFPRPAASLILVRHESAEPEVLMGLRGAGHRFMPNRLVFPGGAVDPADHDAPAAREPQPHVVRLLANQCGPELGRALLLAVARELQEETGLSLGTPPALDTLDYLCRAITPAASPIRFDAHFFVAPADAVTGTLAGSGELERLRWYPVAEALALDLAFVTGHVLQQLQRWLANDDERRRARMRVPVLQERVWSED